MGRLEKCFGPDSRPAAQALGKALEGWENGLRPVLDPTLLGGTRNPSNGQWSVRVNPLSGERVVNRSGPIHASIPLWVGASPAPPHGIFPPFK